MLTPKMRDELYKDAAMHREKAGKHGEHAGLLLYFGGDGDAVSHARLAGSHARRVLELEAQIAKSLKK